MRPPSFLSVQGINFLSFIVLVFALTGQLLAQDANVPASGTISTLQTFEGEQQALAVSLQQLTAQEVSPVQLQAWMQQNAGRLAAQQARAAALMDNAVMLPATVTLTAPPNASPTLRQFLVKIAAKINATTQNPNQFFAAPALSTPVANAQAFSGATAVVASSGDDLEALGAQLADVSRQQPLPVPPPLQLPPNIPSSLQKFLTARDQLIREQVAVHNQSLNLDADTQRLVMAQWQTQNAGRLAQLQLLAPAVNTQDEN